MLYRQSPGSHQPQERCMQALYAPGARVVIRDCEWIVRRADRSDDGGYILTVDGLSELVNGKSARFLTRLEEQARQPPPTTLGHPRTHRRSNRTGKRITGWRGKYLRIPTRNEVSRHGRSICPCLISGR